ncbi:MAG: efflux RND transporter periplasmic adaptor subunit [Bacteroidia bacterium]
MKRNSILALCASLFFILACNENDETNKTANTYPVTKPVYRDTSYFSEYIAEIHSVQNIEIRTRVKGFIEKNHLDEGKNVSQGQLMFSLSSASYKEELLKAKAQVKSAIAEMRTAQLELQNKKLLYNKKIVSKTELEKAEANLEALEAKVEEAKSHEAGAKLHLSYTQIKAPFDGTLNRIPYKVGSLIDEGTLLTTLSNNRQVYAYFNVSEKEYLKYIQRKVTEQDILLQLADNSMHKQPGKIQTIEGEFDRNTGTIAFRAIFPNPEMILKHGASAKVLIKNELKNALLIPQKATFEIQDKFYVFVIDKDNKVRTRNIQIGMRLPHLFLINGGLSSNDVILYEGIQNVKDGDQITPEMENPMRIIAELQAQ